MKIKKKLEKIFNEKIENNISKFDLNEKKFLRRNYLPKCKLKKLSKKEIIDNKSLLEKYKRNNLKLAGITDNLWLPNSVLKVGFDFSDFCVPKDSKSELKQQIINLANRWCNHGSINLEISNNRAACDILIGFRPFFGTWSYVGTYSKIIVNRGKNSMNIDPSWAANIWDLDKNQDNIYKKYLQSSILHEFGHAFGFIHEHQRADRPFTWDIEWMKANKDKLGLDTWEQIVSNYIEKEPMSTLTYGEYDPDSIMCYNWNKNATVEKIGSKINFSLSEKDKEDFSIMYP